MRGFQPLELGAVPSVRSKKDIMKKEIPNVTFKVRELGKWKNVTTAELFDDKRVVVFSLPGAFTPTCSLKQLPNFERLYDEFITKGCNDVYCMSVNDSFVMNAWADEHKINRVKMIPDGNGHFTRRMGMLVNKTHLGFGMRSWRYAMIVNDHSIEQWFEEPGINDQGIDGDPYIETTPEKVLDKLSKTLH